MQHKDFETLIEKYLKDELSIEEKNNVELWLQHITDQTASESLTQPEQDARGERIFEALTQRIERTQKPVVTIHQKMSPLFWIAAMLLLCCSLVFICNTRIMEILNIRQFASTVNSGSNVTKTILSDGSIVWLKGNSKLTYPVKFKGNLRTVDLAGEALFEIAKDAAHPFVIHCAGLSTRVLGTSFNIRHRSNKIEVNVLTGRVFLSSAHSAPIILHPYQKAVYSELKKTIAKAKEPVVEVASLTRGTEYNMLFNDARVRDVLNRIERKFEVDISIGNKKIYDERITADFTDQSLLNTVNMMSEAFNMDFQIEGDSVTLTDKQNHN